MTDRQLLLFLPSAGSLRSSEGFPSAPLAYLRDLRAVLRKVRTTNRSLWRVWRQEEAERSAYDRTFCSCRIERLLP